MWNMFPATMAFCLALSLSHAASLVKPSLQHEHCSWGAQYWCSSSETAALCGKTEWCALNNWPHDVVQDFACMVQQKIIKSARSLIRNSAQKPVTEYDFAMLIAQSCLAFKDVEEKHKCKELATNKDVLPKLVHLVNSKLSVLSVATAVGVCQKNTQEEKPCLRCAAVVSSAQKLISKYLTKDAYIKLIEPQCAKLGQGSKLCQVIGQAKYADFYNSLINASTESVCKGITQCVMSSSVVSTQASTECDVCKTVVKEIRAVDRNPTVQAAIQSLVKSICANLQEFGQICNVVADEAVEYLSELIATEMEPDVICEELKLCTQPEKHSLPKKQTSDIQQQASNTTCSLCKYVVTFLETFLAKNATEEEIEDVLSRACGFLPANWTQECDILVKQYGPFIVQLLLAEMKPELVCTAVGLCTRNTLVSPQVKVQSEIPKQITLDECDICKFVVSYLDTWLDKNSTQAEIENRLNRVCDFLPSAWTQQCKSLVQVYGPLIVKLLMAETSPDQVCGALSLCQGKKLVSPQLKVQSEIPKQITLDECSICKLVVSYLDTWLDKNSTQAEIEDRLNKLCDILPSAWTQQCKSLVKEYGPLIVKLLLEETNPDQVCGALGLCQGKKLDLSQVKIQPKVSKWFDDEKCIICKYVVTYLDTWLNKNSSEVEIETVLREVCQVLPESWSQQCITLVREYSPLIMQLLIGELQPEAVCKLISFCPASNQGTPQVAAPVFKVALPAGAVGKQKTELCALCEALTQALENLLAQKSTQLEIIAALDKVCDLLPISSKAVCVQQLPLYTGFVVDLIEKELSPKLACEFIKFCTEDEVRGVKSKKLESSSQNGALCTICETVFVEVYSLLTENGTEASIKGVIDKVCNRLPSPMNQQCLSFVNLYLPYVIELIVKEETPKQICQYLGFCNATVSQVKSTHSIQVSKADPKAGELCTLCIYVFEGVYQLLPQNSTQADIESALNHVCKALSVYEDQCEHFVALYTPFVVEYLMNRYPPLQICTDFALCTNSTNTRPKPLLFVADTPTTTTPPPIMPYCSDCKFVLYEVQTALPTQLWQNISRTMLLVMCTYLQDSQDVCQQLVNSNFQYVFNEIMDFNFPESFCEAMNLCEVPANRYKPKAVKKVTEGQFCALCDYVVKYLDSELSKSSTLKEIETFLNQACNSVPAAFKSQCMTFVADYTPQIVKFLEIYSPDQICSSLQMCNITPVKAAPKSLMFVSETTASTTPPPFMPYCSDCKFVMFDAQNAVFTPFWQNISQTTLHVACTYLQNSQDVCQQIVNNNFQHVINQMADFNFPEVFCQKMNLCEPQPPGLTANETTCSMCTTVVRVLKSQPHHMTISEDMTTLAESACSKTSVPSQCKAVVAKQMPQIAPLMSHYDNPVSVCEAVSLCQKHSHGMQFRSRRP